MPDFGFGYSTVVDRAFPQLTGTGAVDRQQLTGALTGNQPSLGSTLLYGAINTGFNLLNSYLTSKVSGGQAVATPNIPSVGVPALVPAAAQFLPTMGSPTAQIQAAIPAAEAAAGALTRSGVLAALRALGAKIVGNVAKMAPEVFAKIPAWLKQAAAALGITILADELVDMFNGGGDKKKHRRMNPMNPRAARKAIARIKAVRKTLHKIEKQLPTRTVHVKAAKGRCR